MIACGTALGLSSQLVRYANDGIQDSARMVELPRYATQLMAYRAVDHYVYDCVRSYPLKVPTINAAASSSLLKGSRK